jgi:uncharacterized protein
VSSRSGPDVRKLSPAGWLLVVLLTGYRRFVSPLLGQRCRFYPSCSAYALEAVQVHGALRGSWLAVRRLSRCHPFHAGGLDPVPGTDREKGLASVAGPQVLSSDGSEPIRHESARHEQNTRELSG